MPTGIAFNPEITDITDALKECHGIVAHAAKKLGINKDTLYEYLKKYPELKEQLAKIREHNTQDLLDLSENAIRYSLINIKENPRTGLDAAKYVLDKKGKSREWHPIIDESKYSDEQLDLLNAFMAQFSSLQSARKIDNSNNNAEHKS
jgi:regulatory Fis family protein